MARPAVFLSTEKCSVLFDTRRSPSNFPLSLATLTGPVLYPFFKSVAGSFRTIVDFFFLDDVQACFPRVDALTATAFFPVTLGDVLSYFSLISMPRDSTVFLLG